MMGRRVFRGKSPLELSESEMEEFIKEQKEIYERMVKHLKKARELKKRCSKDEEGHDLFLVNYTKSEKIRAYTYKHTKIPVGFYCPICNQLYDINCKKCKCGD